MSQMLLLSHGGLCCGRKHIYGFHNPPALPVENPIQKGLKGYTNAWFCESAPQENGLQRLDRYLAYVDQYIPKCCVEVTLTSDQKTMWDAHLLERGFKQVAVYTNSNTSRTITVYFRITPLEKPDVGTLELTAKVEPDKPKKPIRRTTKSISIRS